MVIPETNLADFVWQDVSGHADLPALVSPSQKRKKLKKMVSVKELDFLFRIAGAPFESWKSAGKL